MRESRHRASPGWKAQTTHQSEMALFNECTQSCAHIVLDMADIVRDGDLSPIDKTLGKSIPRATVSTLRYYDARPRMK
jgi:phosphoribosylformimino-5-aminoimidazole carboxamide ribonucleotide (ProFAR) isomerase